MAEQSSPSDQDPSGASGPNPLEPEANQAETEPEALPGNRPAEGAPQSSPGTLFGQEWQGQPGATDFLGLDQELAQEPSIPLESVPAPLAAEPLLPESSFEQPESGEASSWFLEGGDDTAVVEDSAREEYEAGEDSPEEDDLLDDDVDESWFEEQPVGALRRLLPVGAVVAVLGLGGAFAYWQFVAKKSAPDGPQVARVSGPVAPTSESSTPRPSTELATPGGENRNTRSIAGPNGRRIPKQPTPVASGAVPGSGKRAPTPGPRVVEPTEVERAPELVSEGSAPNPEAPSNSGIPGQLAALFGPEPVPGEDPDPMAPNPGPDGGESAQSVRPTSPRIAGVDERSTQLQPEELIVDGRELAGLRAASSEDLGAIWPNNTVPEELIRGGRKVLTPGVGRVRVILKGDEIFEGSLYALGMGTVWLESVYGRMGLDNDRIDSIHRISTSAGSPVLGSTGSEGMTGLERVRIQVAGGAFFGKVISRGERKTIVITDGGARLTLANAEVEFVGKNPQVVIKF